MSSVTGFIVPGRGHDHAARAEHLVQLLVECPMVALDTPRLARRRPGRSCRRDALQASSDTPRIVHGARWRSTRSTVERSRLPQRFTVCAGSGAQCDSGHNRGAFVISMKSTVNYVFWRCHKRCVGRGLTTLEPDLRASPTSCAPGERRTKSVTALQDWIAAPPLDRAIEALKSRVRDAFHGDRRDRSYDNEWRVLRRGVERC
jgi:hypothetical protein